MKIIMNGIRGINDTECSYFAVNKAMEERIKEGRNNFKVYTYHGFARTTTISVCRNKNSYTTYVKEE